MLVEYDLDLVQVPDGQEGGPSLFEVGSLVAVDGSAQYSVTPEPSAEGPGALKIPDGACFGLDPSVTGEKTREGA